MNVAAWNIVLPIIITILCIGFIVLMAIMPQSAPEEWSLVALGNDTRTEGEMSGGLFIVSGYLKEGNVCTFAYVDNENGSIHVKTIPLTEYEEFIYTNEAPHVVLNPGTGQGSYYTFYIPEGSVKQQYNIDVSK